MPWERRWRGSLAAKGRPASRSIRRTMRGRRREPISTTMAACGSCRRPRARIWRPRWTCRSTVSRPARAATTRANDPGTSRIRGAAAAGHCAISSNTRPKRRTRCSCMRQSSASGGSRISSRWRRAPCAAGAIGRMRMSFPHARTPSPSRRCSESCSVALSRSAPRSRLFLCKASVTAPGRMSSCCANPTPRLRRHCLKYSTIPIDASIRAAHPSVRTTSRRTRCRC